MLGGARNAAHNMFKSVNGVAIQVGFKLYLEDGIILAAKKYGDNEWKTEEHFKQYFSYLV